MRTVWLYAVLGVVVALSTLVCFGLGLHRRPRYIRNFEQEEFSRDLEFVAPVSVRDGLAIYSAGSGEPVLLFPYPHSQTTSPMAQGPLAELLASAGRRVVTFDVPGTYWSTRDPVGDMAEMIESAEEALFNLGIEGPVDVVGHSMGGLCALAFAIERPQRTRSLVLIGTISGFPAATRWGMPGSRWSVLDADYWRLVVWGMRLTLGRGSLATHKKLHNLMHSAAVYDREFFTPLEIEADDHEKGSPIRQVLWGKNMYRRLSYADRLGSVRSSTLVLVGRHDLETPMAASEELVAGIPDARLVVFERSGHAPHIEEATRFASVVRTFLDDQARVP